MSERFDNQRLTERQRRQVADNLGLVTVHLRRHVRGRDQPTRDREREDLFQEGCLGLIQAAKSFQPLADIPFAAYALPRIHTAVSKALRGGFSIIRQQVYRPRGTTAGDDAEYPATVVLDFDPPDRRADPRHAPAGGPGQQDRETLGERIRARYVRALRRAAEQAKRARPARNDRAELVDRIVEQRLLVPEAEARVSLRCLARQTRSAYARVAQCEKRILDRVRAELIDDAETQRLRQEAKCHPQGMEAAIDARLEAELERIRLDAFIARLLAAPPDQRGLGLLNLIDAAGTSVEAVVRSLARSMPPERRPELLGDAD